MIVVELPKRRISRALNWRQPNCRGNKSNLGLILADRCSAVEYHRMNEGQDRVHECEHVEGISCGVFDLQLMSDKLECQETNCARK